MIILYISIFLLVTFFISWIVVKNSLIAKENQVDNAFATVDTMLKKRFDLIPQLTECVKGYMKHESSLLEKLTSLRSGNRDAKDLAANNLEIQHQFQQFILKAEAYPDLKASDQFMMLQRSMNEMEEQLSAARRTYNMSIQIFNNAVMQFPSSVVANSNNMQKKEYLKFSE